MTNKANVQTIGGHGPGTDRADAERHVHIVVAGLMGAGKTTVGRLVANELGRPFVDSDSIVELLSGHLPPRLAEQEGVAELHAIEGAALRRVAAQRDSVVFAAAASIVDGEVLDELPEVWCVWLDTSPEVLAARVRADRHERPLVGDDPEAVLRAQHERRTQRGRDLAATVVSTDDRTASEVAAAVCDAWRARTRISPTERSS